MISALSLTAVNAVGPRNSKSSANSLSTCAKGLDLGVVGSGVPSTLKITIELASRRLCRDRTMRATGEGGETASAEAKWTGMCVKTV